MSDKFECKECGSEELAINRYAKCLIPVVFKNHTTLEYLEPVVDTDDYIDGEDYFCCFDCGSHVGDYKEPLRTEKELLEYLSCESVENIKL